VTRGARTALIIGIVAVVLVAVLVIGGFIALSLGRLAGATDGYRERRIEGNGREKIAIIDIAGEIHGGESSPSLFGGGGAGAEDITAQLRRAGRDDQVAGVILRIDSPGGAVVASDDIARAVERLSESKPVVASMGDIAASGGYYIASQAQRIIANRGTITGSIGVIAILFNLEGTAQKLGAKPIILKSGDSKDTGSPFREFSDEDRRIYQRLLDESYDQFVDVVAEGRDMEPADVRKLADGRPYSGTDAEKNGLVDELGDLHDAYDAALELADLTREDARLIQYRRPSGFGGLLGVRFGNAVEDVKRELGFEPGLKYLFTP
jgi:protease IV